MSVVENLSEVTMPLPILYVKSNPIQAQITQLKLAQYVKNQQKLKMDVKKLYSMIYNTLSLDSEGCLH
jgi:hypothetical protein